MSDDKPISPHGWIERWKREAEIAPPSHQLPDQRLSTRLVNDFKTRETVAVHDILKFKVEGMHIGTADISRNGIVSFDLSADEAQQLGLGRKPITVQEDTTQIQEKAAHGTTGLAIWLKPDFFDLSDKQNEHASRSSRLMAAKSLCSSLSAKYQIALYSALLPINSRDSAAGSVLVLMTNSSGQYELLEHLRKDLVREINAIRHLPPDPSARPSASR